jgi:hypothetical protein
MFGRESSGLTNEEVAMAGGASAGLGMAAHAASLRCAGKHGLSCALARLFWICLYLAGPQQLLASLILRQ